VEILVGIELLVSQAEDEQFRCGSISMMFLGQFGKRQAGTDNETVEKP
jgi:hypothetical protein